jgi:hypothetical protein
VAVVPVCRGELDTQTDRSADCLIRRRHNRCARSQSTMKLSPFVDDKSGNARRLIAGADHNHRHQECETRSDGKEGHDHQDLVGHGCLRCLLSIQQRRCPFVPNFLVNAS